MVDLAFGDGDYPAYSYVKCHWDENDLLYSEPAHEDQGTADMAIFRDGPPLFDDLGLFLL